VAWTGDARRWRVTARRGGLTARGGHCRWDWWLRMTVKG